MTYRNGSARSTNYNPVLQMGGRPLPPTPCRDAFGGGELTDDHLAAMCDAALIAAGVVLAAGVVGVVGLAVVVKWLVESVK